VSRDDHPAEVSAARRSDRIDDAIEAVYAAQASRERHMTAMSWMVAVPLAAALVAVTVFVAVNAVRGTL
jgi:cell division protein FtsX